MGRRWLSDQHAGVAWRIEGKKKKKKYTANWHSHGILNIPFAVYDLEQKILFAHY